MSRTLELSRTEIFHGMSFCWLNSGLVQNSYRQVKLKCRLLLPEGQAMIFIFVEPCWVIHCSKKFVTIKQGSKLRPTLSQMPAAPATKTSVTVAKLWLDFSQTLAPDDKRDLIRFSTSSPVKRKIPFAETKNQTHLHHAFQNAWVPGNRVQCFGRFLPISHLNVRTATRRDHLK